MRLRQAHKDAWSDQRMEEFIQRAARHLRDDLPEQLEKHGIADEDLCDTIREHCATAEKYGMTGEADLSRYIEFVAILGPKFDTNRGTKWAGEILRREEMEPEEKLDEIAEHLIFSDEEPPVV